MAAFAYATFAAAAHRCTLVPSLSLGVHRQVITGHKDGGLHATNKTPFGRSLQTTGIWHT